jgi:plasmid stabilization system protein ParE
VGQAPLFAPRRGGSRRYHRLHCRTWDAAQADRYLTVLDDYCQRLADTPALGRACDHIRPGLLRAEQAGHVVFFRREVTGILVCRVLHQRMLPGAQPIDDGDE